MFRRQAAGRCHKVVPLRKKWWGRGKGLTPERNGHDSPSFRRLGLDFRVGRGASGDVLKADPHADTASRQEGGSQKNSRVSPRTRR